MMTSDPDPEFEECHIDYRDDPLPRVGDLFGQLIEASYFSKLDLRSEYHQLGIRPKKKNT